MQNHAELQDVKTDPASANGLKCSDPFLLALLSNDHALAEGVVKREAQLQEDFAEVEKHLQARANETNAQLKRLLDIINVRHPNMHSHLLLCSLEPCDRIE